MNWLRKSIYNSFIYQWIIILINWSTKSVFFKAKVYGGFKPKKERYRDLLFYRLSESLSEKMEKVYVPIRKGYEESRIITAMQKAKVFLSERSLILKTVFEFHPMYILVFYIYVDRLVRTVVPGISGVWDELFMVFVLLWLFFLRVIKNKRHVFSSIHLPLLLFMGVYMGIMFYDSPELDVAIEGYRAVAQYMIWFFLVLQLVDEEKVLDRVLFLLVLGISILGAHGTYQYLTGAEMTGNWIDSSETIKTRAFSIAGNPNALASLLVIGFPLALSLFVVEKDIIKKLLFIVMMLFMGTGLILTFTRGAWVAAFVSVLIFFLFVGKRLLIPIITFMLSIVLVFDGLWSRISMLFSNEYIGKASEGGRIYRWTTGIQEWSKSKMFGLGIGRYGGAVATNHKLAPFYMDNYYLKTLTESGIIGLGSFIFLLLATLVQLFAYMKATVNPRYRIIMYGMYSSLLGVLIHNSVENIFEVPFMVTYFWSFVAMIVAMYKLDSQMKVGA